MTRRGRLGRLPRAAPNLTSTILSIAQQMQAARDSNIMDAWKNGGAFEGKAVTDDMVLAYWKDRMEGIDKDDPLYDQLQNNVMHLEYNIAQSKEELVYRQSEPSVAADMRMARFYLNWAKKVDRNSEFWRELQKDAAQFTQSAKARSRAGAGQAAEDAYAGERDRILKSGDAGAILTSVLTQIARDNNVIGIDEDLNKVRLAGENDPGRMQALMRLLNDDIVANPGRYAGLIDQLKAADPNFTGQITADYVAGAIRDQSTAYSTAAALALKTGHKGEYDTFTTDSEKTSFTAQNIGAWDAAELYQKAFDRRQMVLDDPNSSDEERRQAGIKFANAVDKIAGDPGLAPAISNRMRNDAAASRGDLNAGQIDSTYSNFLGLKDLAAGTTTEGGTPKGINAEIAEQMDRYNQGHEAILADPSAYAYATINEQGEFDPLGTRIGVVSGAEVSNHPSHPQVVVVPQLFGGALSVLVGTQPVFARDSAGEQQVGSMLTYHVGGTTVRLYGIRNPGDGQTIWTADPPFNPNAIVTYDEKGAHIDVTGLPGSFPAGLSGSVTDELDPAVGPDGRAYRDTVVKKVDSKGVVTETVTRVYGDMVPRSKTDATLVFRGSGDKQVFAPKISEARALTDIAFDSARMIAGGDNNTDFTTPALASLSILPPAEAFFASQTMIRDPQFMAALEGQEWQAAGMTTGDANDPALGRYQALRERNWSALTGIDGVFNGSARFTNPKVPPEVRAKAINLQETVGMLLGWTKAIKGKPVISLGAGIKLPENPLAPQVNQQTGFDVQQALNPSTGFDLRPPAAPPVAPAAPVTPTASPTPTPIAPSTNPVPVAPTPRVSLPYVPPRHAPGTGPLEF